MSKESLIKEILIKDFIKIRKRAPTTTEMNHFYNEFLLKNPKYQTLGLAAGTSFHFRGQANKESSADNFTTSLSRCLSEQKSLIKTLKNLDIKSESIFRVYNNKLSEALNEIRSLERTINKNLLLYSKDDIYTHGMIESFQDYDMINFDESNIYMFNGKATLGFTKVAGEGFDSRELSYRVSSRTGESLTQRNLNNISSALKEDGDFFKVLVFCNKPNETVDFHIDLDFNDAKHVDTLKFTTQAIESNSKIIYRAYYSLDETNYQECFESALTINNNENYVEVNKEGVKSVRLTFSKDGYDYKDGNRFVYIFALDFIGGTTKKFKINEESILSLGPYKILDEENNEVNFSMATIKGGTCCIVPDKTSIDFYLSKDKINWFKTDYAGGGKQVIQFEESNEPFDGTGYFKPYGESSINTNLYPLIEDYSKVAIDLPPNHKLLNFYIETADFNNIVKQSLKIKRNVCLKKNQITYDAKEGWWKSDNNYFCTQFQIIEPEGRYFDFGERSCFINGKLLSGKHFVPYGIHKFKTSEENWFDLNLSAEQNVAHESQLKEIDMLYPYNHKYVIEGFQYNTTYRGDRLYSGADKVFSFDLKEVSNQRFLLDGSLETFTFVKSVFENAQGVEVDAIFIMVNIKTETGEAKNEKYDIKCKKRNTPQGGSGNLYIKAILKSLDATVTPKIDQIQVRVI
jgi:hypothetical protein